jgi:hypothetical protein
MGDLLTPEYFCHFLHARGMEFNLPCVCYYMDNPYAKKWQGLCTFSKILICQQTSNLCEQILEDGRRDPG